ncbi:MAG: hypothetical protein K2K15_06360, partial [Anaeroplasmataceae bacterium]|nr:hypothetical protein [Anaeroplasmataceae bacterium]
TIFIISKNKNVVEEEIIYSIPRITTYHYAPEKRMNFEVYINSEHSLIEYTEKNTYLLSTSYATFPLMNVSVSKVLDFIDKEESFYKYSIEADLFSMQEEDIILEDCYLKIKNESFIIEAPVGYLAIYRNNYIPLDFTDLYGNYTYVNDELHLVGITIQLSKKYNSLKQVKIGSITANKRYIEQDMLYDSERFLSEVQQPIFEQDFTSDAYPLRAKEGYYYIPFSYKSIVLITKACVLLQIDDEVYYIEDFPYLANEIHISDYQKTRVKGTIKYA